MDEYNVPAAVEEDRQQRGGGGRNYSVNQQRLRPYREGSTEANHLQFLLYNPAIWDMFRGVIAPSTRTYWMPTYHHYMGGGKDRVSTLCKKKMNTYYAEKYGAPVIFAPVACPECGTIGVFANCVKCHTTLGLRVRDDLCPSCDEADRKWRDYDAEWEVVFRERRMPVDESVKKTRGKLKREQNALYKELSGSGTKIKEKQEIASAWSPRDRFIYVVFDIDKMMRRRTLQEGEPEETRMTLLFSGTTVQQALEGKHNNRKRFWDPTAGMEIVITRDTRNGLEQARYTVDDAAGPTFAPEWIEYLTNYSAMPDPSAEMQVLGYDEHVNKAGLTLTREEVVAQPGPASPPTTAASPPYVPPPTSAPTPGVPSTPPVGLGRPPVSAPTPGAPPAVPPTSAPPMSAPPIGRSAPPVLGAPPATSPPPVPGAPPTSPPTSTPPGPPVPEDPSQGRRQTW